jgi:hypothetical protein
MSAVTAQAGLELLQSGFEALSILVWKSRDPVVDTETKYTVTLDKLTTVLSSKTAIHRHTDTFTRTHSHANTTRPEPVPTLH